MGSPEVTITPREAAAIEVARVDWKAVAEVTGLNANDIAAQWAPELDPDEIAVLTQSSGAATK